MKINPSGFRKDTELLFKHIKAFGKVEKQPTPFIVATDEELKICHTLEELYTYPKETEVLRAWPGKKRTDVFYFTVGSLRG